MIRSTPVWVEKLQRKWRRRRLVAMERLLAVRPGAHILDIGGQLEMWSLTRQAYHVVLLNLSQEDAVPPRPWLWPTQGTTWEVHVGDARDLSAFADGSFALVFSNSLIEHLPVADRRRFAAEVRRVGRTFWVQTPNPWFPIEAHSRLPFYWLYPPPWRRSLAAWIDERRAGFPGHCPMRGTSALRRRDLRQLFPDADIFAERLLGLPKSWAAFSGRRP